MIGFAGGLATCLGRGAVTVEHVLIAQLYQRSFFGGSPSATPAAVLAALVDLGVPVPEAPLPKERTPFRASEQIDVSAEDLECLISALPRLLPAPGIAWNRKGKGGWVRSLAGIELSEIIAFALDAWSRRRLPCVCCGFAALSLDEPLGERLCPVCSWIDDPIQNNNPAYGGGVNGVSLNDAREAFSRHGYARVAGRDSVRPAEPNEIPPSIPTETIS
jgi:hypothetical protein